MEEDDLADSPSLSGRLLWDLLCAQHASLGPKVDRGSALDDSVCFVLPLVWYFSAAGVRRLLLWVQKGCCRRSSSHQQNPAPDP